MFVVNPQQGNGLLPLSGGPPDMKAETKDYVRLQNVYREKALSDASLVRSNVHKLLTSLGLAKGKFSDEEIDAWCRQANHVRCLRFRSLQNEILCDNFHAQTIYSKLNDNPESLVPIYVAIRAYQHYIDDQYLYRELTATSQEPPSLSTLSSPGQSDVKMDFEEKELAGYVNQYLKTVFQGAVPVGTETDCKTWITGVAQNIHGWLKEVVRCGGGELHNIASLTGMVAQEIIKLVTKQYVPVNNTVLFDA